MELAALFGGVTGLLGTGLTYVMDHFKQKRDAAARIEEAKINLQIAQMEIDKVKAMGEANLRIAITEGDNAAVVGSYENDKATYSGNTKAPKLVQYLLGLVDFLRGIIRPGTTIGYGALFAWLVVIAVSIIGAQKLADSNLDKLIDAAIYLATTTTLWWFGVRPIAKK